MESTKITVSAIINAPIEITWKHWTTDKSIEQWNFAADEWHCPKAEIDLKEGGKFSYRMEAKDGSFGFDFSGEFVQIQPLKNIAVALDDGRSLDVEFNQLGNQTVVTEVFEAETSNPIELQEQGWQMILNNFKKLVEQ